jgi:DNA-binding transcriptional LysR family regulator
MDFDHSIVAEERLPAAQSGSDIGRTPSFRDPSRGLVLGSNPVAAKNCERFLAALRRLKSRPRALIIRGGLDRSGAEALYQAPTSSASARTSMAPEMLRSSAAATICPLPMVRSTACGFDPVYFLGRVFSRAAC